MPRPWLHRATRTYDCPHRPSVSARGWGRSCSTCTQTNQARYACRYSVPCGHGGTTPSWTSDASAGVPPGAAARQGRTAHERVGADRPLVGRRRPQVGDQHPAEVRRGHPATAGADLAARESGAFVQRRGGGYILSAVPGAIDLVDFRLHVERARGHLAAGRLDSASDDFVHALALWHGPAGDGLSHSMTAAPLFAGLDNEFFDACVSAAELAGTQGHSDRVVQPLRLAAWMAPLNEPVQASLVDALSASGRQAEALSVLEGVRTRLADELGVSPGHSLRDAHTRALGPAAQTSMTASSSAPTSSAAAPCRRTLGRHPSRRQSGSAASWVGQRSSRC